MIARDFHLRFTSEVSYFLEDGVTTDHPDRDGFRVMIAGTPGEAQANRPRSVATKPGVTPFPVASESYVEGATMEFPLQPRTPTIGDNSWTHALAVSNQSASFGTVRGKLTLAVPAGGLLGNVSRCSVAIVLADRTGPADY